MFFFSPAVALPGVEVVLPDPRPPGGEVELLGSAPPSGAVELLGPGPPGEEDELLGPVPPDAKVGLLGALDDRSGMDGSATSMTSEAETPPWDSMSSIARKTSSSSPSPLIVNLEPSKNIFPLKRFPLNRCTTIRHFYHTNKRTSRKLFLALHEYSDINADLGSPFVD
jgi:hypothetical protein